MRKTLIFLTFVAALVLGAAAVYLGGLNQDEGWYLYAANLVAEGQQPYRDFAFTQGPVMPAVYALLAPAWQHFGILGGRLVTLSLGLLGLLFACVLTRRLGGSAIVTFLLLGCNLYHLYFLALPKTYALASLFVLAGACLLTYDRFYTAFLGGMLLAFAAGTRFSLGLMLPVIGLVFMLQRRHWFWYGVGGALGLGIVFGPTLWDPATRTGLLEAVSYHSARGSSGVIFALGSLSRLVRWYLPVLVVGALGLWRWCQEEMDYTGASLEAEEAGDTTRDMPRAAFLWAALAVMGAQLCAPFPYDDYQVPVMGLLTVLAVVAAAPVLKRSPHAFLALFALTMGLAFGSPLLQEWMSNGQDRFWSLTKSEPELVQLRQVASRIRALDPRGTEILTQDLYLAIELNRKVPEGLEMGPFSSLTDAEWRALLETTRCPIAALSGYTFAIEPPRCAPRAMAEQMEYWRILRKHYDLVDRVPFFGQQATTLLILAHKQESR